MMMCEFDRGTGYVAYFNNNQAELAQKEMTEFFNLNFAGTMVERINALEHVCIYYSASDLDRLITSNMVF